MPLTIIPHSIKEYKKKKTWFPASFPDGRVLRIAVASLAVAYFWSDIRPELPTRPSDVSALTAQMEGCRNKRRRISAHGESRAGLSIQADSGSILNTHASDRDTGKTVRRQRSGLTNSSKSLTRKFQASRKYVRAGVQFNGAGRRQLQTNLQHRGQCPVAVPVSANENDT